jgi:hypothetical protein
VISFFESDTIYNISIEPPNRNVNIPRKEPYGDIDNTTLPPAVYKEERKLLCKKCGYEWIVDWYEGLSKPPRKCPSCKSKTWNKTVGWAWTISKENERPGGENNWVPTMEEVHERIMQIDSIEDRCLIAMTYLTAGRITEIVKSITPEDVSFGPYYGTECMVIHMPNRKHRLRHEKDVPIPIEKERDLVNMIQSWISSLPKGEPIFNFSRVIGWKKIRKNFGCTSHWLRHVRLTHMVTNYDFNEQKLIKLAGWTDGRGAKHYIELKAKDIIY